MNIKNNAELEEFLELAIYAAKKAGKFLINQHKFIKRKSNLKNSSIKQDKDSEMLIFKILKTKYPNHDFLAEESGKQNNKSKYKWIIDPIDGTNNYIDGRDTYSVSIGLEKNNQIVIGVVYLPKRDELFYAIKGKGAYLNGKLIKISNQNNISKSIIHYSTYPGYEHKTEQLNENILKSFPKIKYFSYINKKNIDPIWGRGSMAAELCYLACGRIDGLIRLKQKPWDVAGGCVIAKEAGAKMNNLKNKKCSIYEGDFIVANPNLLKKINKIIKV
jgi:myo-inositol-1(or 4)-monophosphatase